MAESSTVNLPYRGHLHSAPEKKFSAVVLLVPFFGAHGNALNRHVKMLNDFGYDCYTFSLKDNFSRMPTGLVSGSSAFGLKNVWTDQIERMLNEIPGKKIIYAFSNPSASAIEAICRRNASDVLGMICDGGPSGEFLNSLYNYFVHEQPLKTFPLRMGAAITASLLWHPRFNKVLHEDLNKLPSGFRMLSIRGWKDKLITPSMIDKVFEPHPQIDWQKLSLPQAGHLNGLKDYPEEYIPPVQRFLETLSLK